MNIESLQDKSKKMRVYWNSDTDISYYYIDNIEEVKIIFDILTIKDLASESIIWNIQGVQVLNEDNEWEEWFDDEGCDYNEHFEEREV